MMLVQNRFKCTVHASLFRAPSKMGGNAVFMSENGLLDSIQILAMQSENILQQLPK